MIRPRGAAAADPLLITGVLGAAAALRRLRALIAELAADDADADPDDAGGDVVDVVLGLAALVAAVECRFPDSPVTPGVVDPAADACPTNRPINLLVKELLR